MFRCFSFHFSSFSSIPGHVQKNTQIEFVRVVEAEPEESVRAFDLVN